MNRTMLVIGMYVASACGVATDKHQAALDDLDRTRAQFEQTQAQLEETKQKASQKEQLLAQALDQNSTLSTKISAMGENVEDLMDEKGELAAERERLAKQIVELQRLREAAEQREADFRRVVSALQKMIDAGTLTVKVRNGLMVVQMASDVVFPAGGTKIKGAAKEALAELAQTIGTFEGRRFQVVGHSDPTPINTARFPSNWELSSQRAVEVVKFLVENGVPPEMVNAAGNAQFDPLVENDTPENRAMNRRVEVVFIPKIDELPGFESTN